jgi:hypothetical protein
VTALADRRQECCSHALFGHLCSMDVTIALFSMLNLLQCIWLVLTPVFVRVQSLAAA